MYSTNIFTAGARFRLGSATMHIVAASARSIGRWWVHRRDVEHLQSLPDYMLKDIGLHRPQITSVVVHGSQGFYRSRQ